MTEEQEAAVVATPRPIRRLEESVVNRIAAGEVVQRPANALKEMIENCIDAKAKSISITVADGGLKLLRISDDGVGIRESDLPLLAERFATSKLESFDDLKKMATFGFRGEALASISHVARLHVTTKTRDERCAYKASYADGKILHGGAKACAGVNGTTITVEGLYHNMPARRRAFASAAEQYNAMLKVVSGYAIHYGDRGIALSCRKLDCNSDVSTPQTGATRLSNIALVYGRTLAESLVALELKSTEFEIQGFVTKGDNMSSNVKGGKLFTLFVNDRLVENGSMKRCFEEAYAPVLPRGVKPFAYVALTVPPHEVDVNIHPTKREVCLLRETEICDALRAKLEGLLATCNDTRRFEEASFTQTKLVEQEEEEPPQKKQKPVAKNPSKMVRSDHRDQKIDSFFGPSTEKLPPPPRAVRMTTTSEKRLCCDCGINEAAAAPVENDIIPGAFAEAAFRGSRLPRCAGCSSKAPKEEVVLGSLSKTVDLTECEYTSVTDLIAEIDREEDKKGDYALALKRHVFVGALDAKWALIQHSTQLSRVDHAELASELFYQLAVRRFGRCGTLELNGLDVYEAIKAHLAASDEQNVESRAREAQESLVSHALMLEEYFHIKISADGLLTAMPELLNGHTPCGSALPSFLCRLATEVDWRYERACFEGIAVELATCYATLQCDLKTGAPTARALETVRVLLFPAFRSLLLLPRGLANPQVFHPLASLDRLYRVFERC